MRSPTASKVHARGELAVEAQEIEKRATHRVSAPCPKIEQR